MYISSIKYRPTEFEDVIGQNIITETLKRAIYKKRLAQALLFCGPQGVGKTTCARIVAKKINYPLEDVNLNIIELDAASNNSIEDIRNIIDRIYFPPQKGKYKIYIIDEVHMLSKAAFNAFLKTLEEPPAHIIFILATTEKHKILPTIISRCQVYEFKRISTTDIQLYLKLIAKKEGIKVTDDILFMIAKQANGAIRDALSIFDRLVSYSGKILIKKYVEDQLGILDNIFFFKITNFIIKNDISRTLLLFDKILERGFYIDLFINRLANHFRELFISKDPITIKLIENTEDMKKLYCIQASQINKNLLINAIEICQNAEFNCKKSSNPRLSAEIALIKLALLN
ncbi:MAG: DNA polymerase III subunit gamma/tau [Candidatus Bostrichicola ureolyticus]|nr:MAG: DNA polymerase III subunit gamma/tau [Candidatus Bostrichicola ureolyticus]